MQLLWERLNDASEVTKTVIRVSFQSRERNTYKSVVAMRNMIVQHDNNTNTYPLIRLVPSRWKSECGDGRGTSPMGCIDMGN